MLLGEILCPSEASVQNLRGAVILRVAQMGTPYILPVPRCLTNLTLDMALGSSTVPRGEQELSH